MTKIKKPEKSGGSPVKQLESELGGLRRDLRQTVKAYVRRLETDLLRSSDELKKFGPIEELSRENLHTVRDMTMLLRKRKLKPEKGRRKDLRQIDSLIEDLQMFVRSGNGHSD